MSHHAQLSPEALQALQNQRRNSTISAIILALLGTALVVAILFFIALSPFFKNEDELVTYSSGTDAIEKITKPEMTNEVEKKPSSPSSSMAKVIAANTPSPVAIPVPKETAVEPSLDFGAGNDFGDGWGGGTSGDGGGGGGGASFFNQKVTAERIAYVIDYSLSMKAKNKIALMKAELSKSVGSLPNTVDYSLIFFAGPAWVAGDKVSQGGKGIHPVVNSGGKKYEWLNTGGPHNFTPANLSKRQTADWLRSNDRQREESLKIIEETAMVWGTVWEHPLKMALDMNPKPDVIFFMTDGSAGKESASVADELGKLARKEGVIVNTVALMEPKAKGPMGQLAKITGGVFTMVESDGSIKQVDVK